MSPLEILLCILVAAAFIFGIGVGRTHQMEIYPNHLQKHIMMLAYNPSCQFCQIEKYVDEAHHGPLPIKAVNRVK